MGSIFPLLIAFIIAKSIIRQKKENQASKAIPMISVVDDAYNRYGPSETMLRVCTEYFMHSNTAPTMEQNLQLMEVRLLLQQYETLEGQLFAIHAESLPVNLRLRYYNLVIQHAIMTGATKRAVDVFANTQDFAEKYLMYHEEDMLNYFDNAATVCALTGDFEESERYCEAMECFLQKRNILTSENFIPKFARIKMLFLAHRDAEAEALSKQMKSEISGFHQFRYAWESSFLMRELEKTQMFRQETEQGEYGGMMQAY